MSTRVAVVLLTRVNLGRVRSPELAEFTIWVQMYCFLDLSLDQDIQRPMRDAIIFSPGLIALVLGTAEEPSLAKRQRVKPSKLDLPEREPIDSLLCKHCLVSFDGLHHDLLGGDFSLCFVLPDNLTFAESESRLHEMGGCGGELSDRLSHFERNFADGDGL